jgi:uncharacterized membrane protein YphA (DoxX/SURF4 family)
MDSQRLGVLTLRYGLALVFLWFGFSQLTNPADWTSFVPLLIARLSPLPVTVIVLLNGLLEVVCGILLVLNIWVRWAALLMGLHLAGIAISLGYNSVAVRDFGLMMATFSLALLHHDTRHG